MRPSELHTGPDHRFFYPLNGEIEHHSSFDTSDKPEVIIIPGENHFAVYKDENDQFSASNIEARAFIPQGVKIQKVAEYNVDENEQSAPFFLQGYELAQLNRSGSYAPTPNDKIILSVDDATLDDDFTIENYRKPRFGVGGTLIIPASRSLPTRSDFHLSNYVPASYELLGFINQKNKLVVASTASLGIQKIVDLCVAANSTQNDLEQSLLHDELWSNSLSGLVEVKARLGLVAYLKYFDELNQTNFLPTKETDKKINGPVNLDKHQIRLRRLVTAMRSKSDVPVRKELS